MATYTIDTRKYFQNPQAPPQTSDNPPSPFNPTYPPPQPPPTLPQNTGLLDLLGQPALAGNLRMMLGLSPYASPDPATNFYAGLNGITGYDPNRTPTAPAPAAANYPNPQSGSITAAGTPPQTGAFAGATGSMPTGVNGTLPPSAANYPNPQAITTLPPRTVVPPNTRPGPLAPTTTSTNGISADEARWASIAAQHGLDWNITKSVYMNPARNGTNNPATALDRQWRDKAWGDAAFRAGVLTGNPSADARVWMDHYNAGNNLNYDPLIGHPSAIAQYQETLKQGPNPSSGAYPAWYNQQTVGMPQGGGGAAPQSPLAPTPTPVPAPTAPTDTTQTTASTDNTIPPISSPFDTTNVGAMRW